MHAILSVITTILFKFYYSSHTNPGLDTNEILKDSPVIYQLFSVRLQRGTSTIRTYVNKPYGMFYFPLNFVLSPLDT